MPQTGHRIALVYVASNRVRLIPEDQPERLFDLSEIFLGINAHERTRRAILFARIGRTRRAVRISEVCSQRLHLMAIMSSASAIGAGAGALTLKIFLIRV